MTLFCVCHIFFLDLYRRNRLRNRNDYRQQLGKNISRVQLSILPSDFGLGGYLGPELTTAISDKTRGEAYVKEFYRKMEAEPECLIFISVKNKQKHW